MFEQFAEVPQATQSQDLRYQLGLSAAQYTDALSSQVSGNIDLRVLEIYGVYSKRSFLEVNDHGRQLKSALTGFDQSFLAEIARYFLTAKHHYGRLGAGFFRFPDSLYQGARVSLSTGIEPSDTLPWELKLRLSLFLPFTGNDKVYNFELACAKQYGASRLGGFSAVSIRPRDTSVGIYEYMLFSIGPYWDLTLGPSRLNLSARWRIWLDKDVFLRSAQLAIANPNEMVPLPDFKLQWSFLF
jgi:hypothetical protein